MQFRATEGINTKFSLEFSYPKESCLKNEIKMQMDYNPLLFPRKQLKYARQEVLPRDKVHLVEKN